MTTPRKILFVVAHPPLRGALPRELLDAMLVGAVFEQHISVLFIDDGVFQLLGAAHIDGTIARGFGALPAYDVEQVYVDSTALRRRGLELSNLVLPVRGLTRGGVRKLVAKQDIVIND